MSVSVTWGTWPEDTELDSDDILSWMGGNPETLEGKRVEWDEYLDSFVSTIHPHLEALRADIIANHIRGDGTWHQEDPEGTPMFSDGKIMALSFRAWGDLMAAIWTTEDDKHYSYMDFYCCGNWQ